MSHPLHSNSVDVTNAPIALFDPRRGAARLECTHFCFHSSLFSTRIRSRRKTLNRVFVFCLSAPSTVQLEPCGHGCLGEPCLKQIVACDKQRTTCRTGISGYTQGNQMAREETYCEPESRQVTVRRLQVEAGGVDSSFWNSRQTSSQLLIMTVLLAAIGISCYAWIKRKHFPTPWDLATCPVLGQKCDWTCPTACECSALKTSRAGCILLENCERAKGDKLGLESGFERLSDVANISKGNARRRNGSYSGTADKRIGGAVMSS